MASLALKSIIHASPGPRSKALNEQIDTEQELKRTKNAPSEAKIHYVDLAKSASEITDIDGHIFRELLWSGCQELMLNMEKINKINVFPIPDSDTGINMVNTMKPAVISIVAYPEKDLTKTCLKVSSSCVLNAAGNSGTMLSHFFAKLSNELNGAESISISKFSEALAKSGSTMIETVDKPVYGTLMSVIMEATKQCAEAKPENLKDLWTALFNAAKDATNRSPDELIVDGKKVLAGLDVVDSGAYGFQCLIAGGYQAITNSDHTYDFTGISVNPNDSTEISKDYDAESVDAHSACTHVNANRYCTECIAKFNTGKYEEQLNLSNTPNIETLVKDSIRDLGESIVVVVAPTDGGHVSKVHIHTAEPEKVFQTLRDISGQKVLVKEKVDDMKYQVDSRNTMPPDMSKSKVAILSYATQTVPYWLDSCHHEMFVYCIVNGEPYRNMIDILPLSFYNRLRSETGLQTSTGAPPAKVFTAYFLDLLDKYEELVYIPINLAMSKGTTNALAQGIEALPKELQPKVFTHKAVACNAMQGLITLKACELAATGMSGAEIVDTLHNKVIPNIMAVSLLYDPLPAVKGGRGPPWILQMLPCGGHVALGDLDFTKPMSNEVVPQVVRFFKSASAVAMQNTKLLDANQMSNEDLKVTIPDILNTWHKGEKYDGMAGHEKLLGKYTNDESGSNAFLDDLLNMRKDPMIRKAIDMSKENPNKDPFILLQDMVIDQMKATTDPNDKFYVLIAHTGRPDAHRHLEDRLRNEFNIVGLDKGYTDCVIGVHLGLRSIGLAIMKVN